MCAVSTADTEKKKARERYLSSFGITYEVRHGSNRKNVVVSESLLLEGGVNVSPREKRVTLRLQAYTGEKGNSVTVYIPIEGIRLLLDRFDRDEKEKALLSILSSNQ